MTTTQRILEIVRNLDEADLETVGGITATLSDDELLDTSMWVDENALDDPSVFVKTSDRDLGPWVADALDEEINCRSLLEPVCTTWVN